MIDLDSRSLPSALQRGYHAAVANNAYTTPFPQPAGTKGNFRVYLRGIHILVTTAGLYYVSLTTAPAYNGYATFLDLYLAANAQEHITFGGDVALPPGDALAIQNASGSASDITIAWEYALHYES